jgi:anti-sigma regulatory factor (Ser/Thr protein kinase)
VDEAGAAQSDALLAERFRQERSFTLGIFLIRQIMDEITYVYRKGFENQLEMICFL